MISAGRPFQIYALELHAVGHCNLSCQGCAQSSPSVRSRFEDLAVLERSLETLRGVISCDKLQVLGGEPLLHPRLVDLLGLAIQSGLSQHLCVKTNGLLLPRMPPEFWRAADSVIVSIYPASRAALERRRVEMEERARAGQAALCYRPYDTFRHILGSAGRASERMTRRVFDACEFKRFTHSLSAGHLYRCAPSVNLAAAGLRVDGTDSLDLFNTPSLGAAVVRFLQSGTPLSSCRHCLGSSGGLFEHSMLKRSRTASHDHHA